MWLFISHQLTVNGSDVCITMWPGKEWLCLHCYPFPWVNGENSMDLKKIRATQWKEPGSWMATWSRATSPSHLGLWHEQDIISDSVLSHSNVGVVSKELACNKMYIHTNFCLLDTYIEQYQTGTLGTGYRRLCLPVFVRVCKVSKEFQAGRQEGNGVNHWPPYTEHYYMYLVPYASISSTPSHFILSKPCSPFSRWGN